MAVMFNGDYSMHPRLALPPDLPDLLKLFTKAAIKTQPCDLLTWSAGYFKCLVEDEPLPVKERLELDGNGKVTLGLLRVLNSQNKNKEFVSVLELKRKCEVVGLTSKLFDDVIARGAFKNRIRWETFLAVLCSHITKNVFEAVTLFCEVLTEEGEGGPALIPHLKFIRALSTVVGPKLQLNNWKELVFHLVKCSKSQNGMNHPGNLRRLQFN